MNECTTCNGWGLKIVRPGIPNIWKTCTDCKGVGSDIYAGLVRSAQEIATLAHRGQYRRNKDGTPSNEAYIHHCKRVAEKVEGDPAAECVAWLHDTLEDHPDKVTRESLEKASMPQDVIEAVEALTKKPGEAYHIYLLGVKINPLARKVKVMDMIDNLASDPTDKQIVKYSAGLAYLACDEATLRSLKLVL